MRMIKLLGVKMLQNMKANSEAYRKSVFRPDGSIVINHDQTRNKIFVSTQLDGLTSAELQELGFYLMKMCFNRNMNSIIENDHIEYWSHVSNLARNNNQVDRWLRTHNPIFSFIDSQLVNELRPQYNDNVNKRSQNTLLTEVSYHDFFPSVWSGFAFLEGVCRRLCHVYLTSDGEVKKAFKVKGVQYRSRAGNLKCTRRNKGSPRISNLGHALELTRRNVDSDTRTILTNFLNLHSASEIFDWRNTCLHGSEDKSTVVIVLYCLISLLVLDAIKNS
jgi:hypothetical protein